MEKQGRKGYVQVVGLVPPCSGLWFPFLSTEDEDMSWSRHENTVQRGLVPGWHTWHQTPAVPAEWQVDGPQQAGWA